MLNPLLNAMEVFADPCGSLVEHGGVRDDIVAIQESKNSWAREIVYNSKIFLVLTLKP